MNRSLVKTVQLISIRCFRTPINSKLWQFPKTFPVSTIQPTTIRFCTEAAKEPTKLSVKEKLKVAVTQYGPTVIIFHVTISLASLGICYFLISEGVDLDAFMDRLGIFDNLKVTETSEKFDGKAVATNASTFVVAYAVHKLLSPVRLGITLTTVPFLVRYLRSKGILKKPN